MKSKFLSTKLADLDGRLYLAGYSGLCLPRWLRKVIAGSTWHRSWLEGFMGIFVEGDGTRIGVCDRNWYSFRKGKYAARSSMFDLLGKLLH